MSANAWESDWSSSTGVRVKHIMGMRFWVVGGSFCISTGPGAKWAGQENKAAAKSMRQRGS